jgi:hypothetical protein
MSNRPLDRRDLLAELAVGDHQCTARSKRTGKRCRLPSMLGSNVCRSHGGASPQVRAKAKQRLEQAADVLVQRLLSFALDGDVSDPVALQAIRDALDRAGLSPKHAVQLSTAEPAPWEVIFANLPRGPQEEIRSPRPAQRLLPVPEVIDAEVIEEPSEPRPHEPTDELNPYDRPEPPTEAPQPPSGALTTMELAISETAHHVPRPRRTTRRKR